MAEPMKLFFSGIRQADKKRLDRDILFLAIPVFINQGINSMVALIGRIIMGKLGDQAYNSISIGMMVFTLVITIIGAIGVGTTTLVAQNWGIGNRERANEILQQSLFAGFFISILLVIIGLASRRVLFTLLGADPVTAQVGSEYLFWLYLGLPFVIPGFFLASALRGAGDTRTPMQAGVVMSVLSLAASYALILGKFGFPRLQWVGAALAVNISFFAFTCILAVLILANRTVLRLPAKGWRLDRQTFFSIFRIGLPSATEWILIQLGMLLYISVVTYYGKEALAGYFTGLAILGLAQSVNMGFQTASTTLVGQCVGAKNFPEAEHVFRRTAFLGFFTMVAFGAIFIICAAPPVLSFLFNKLDPRSLEYTRFYIYLLAVAMPLMGVSFSIAGGLRGAGNTILPLIASSVGVYGGRILFAMLIYHLFHPPVYIVWCSMFPDLMIRTTIMAIGLKSGKWKTVDIKL